ncbi:hypothetical protein C0Q70_11001 [Pomacea canaliculata]|uniref:G-protein coupled receptors family 1 profile domain-containing protein n=1 Tax=Pomacea canaliculata TaxID=400727 RepID=A0A2T7P4R4_POMCA|nr:hypothetical protein C0Q70_11001 [Pomacea canaliculata]
MKLLTGSRYSGMLGILLKNKVMALCGPSSAKNSNHWAIIVVAAIVIVGPFFIVSARWTVGCVYDPVAKSPVHTTYSSDFYLAHAHLVDTLEGVVYGVILPVFCVSVVTTASAITAVKLRHMAAWRQQTSSAASSGTRDVTLTRMLIGMSILFVTCNVPGICFRIAMLAVPDMSLDGKRMLKS